MNMHQNWTVLCLLALIPQIGGCATPAKHSKSSPVISHEADHPAAAIATKMLGKPYRYGGASPRGFDCSGLVYYAYHKAGYKVPRTSQQQYRNSLPVKQAQMREGDLLFFRIEGKVSHVGVYLGNNMFIHAPSSSKRVTIASLDSPYWKPRLTKTGRFF
ncbi:MAG: C40 family peptidase [Pseudomonadota bacterium]